jgi:hypothetical protein
MSVATGSEQQQLVNEWNARHPVGTRQVAAVDRAMRMARLVEAAEINGALPEVTRV